MTSAVRPGGGGRLQDACERSLAVRGGRRRRCSRTALGHERVELSLVLGNAEPFEEFAKLALLLFEPPQRLGPVFIERPIAARWRLPPPVRGLAPVIVHHALAASPGLASSPTAHASTPYEIGQGRETQWPPDDEADERQREPRSRSEF